MVTSKFIELTILAAFPLIQFAEARNPTWIDMVADDDVDLDEVRALAMRYLPDDAPFTIVIWDSVESFRKLQEFQNRESLIDGE